MVDPSKDAQSETTVRFVAGLPTGVKVNCMLHNLSESDLSRLRVRVSNFSVAMKPTAVLRWDIPTRRCPTSDRGHPTSWCSATTSLGSPPRYSCLPLCGLRQPKCISLAVSSSTDAPQSVRVGPLSIRRRVSSCHCRMRTSRRRSTRSQ